MKLLCLQHVPFEGPAAIGEWAEDRGFEVSVFKVWEKRPFPVLRDVDLLAVMGGPMNVDEEPLYPWLAEEKKFIAAAVRAGKKMIGVCLGAQLIARALGKRVYKNSQKEIGWWPVTWTPEARRHAFFEGFPETTVVFQWHGDTFDLPDGAVHLAKSEACMNQAFLYEGRVLGLQFHLETTPESAALRVKNCADELVPAKYIQSGESILGETRYYAEISRALNRMLDVLLKQPSVTV